MPRGNPGIFLIEMFIGEAGLCLQNCCGCGKIFMFVKVIKIPFWSLYFVLAKQMFGCYNSEAL